ncbi:hypothetical protein APSETT445_004151 [Aspergillus pseudonomiae]
MLPLGLRVQDKLERLIDKHMRSVGASKVSLSSISSQELWERSGRLGEGSEVFRFHDRKESRYLLAPTHEEEITTLVGTAYTRLFNDLKIPYLVAAADSGNMGGNLSHEFHVPSSKGEDTVISCTSCDTVYNDELADGKIHEFGDNESAQASAGFDTGDISPEAAPTISTGLWMSISQDKRTLLRGWYPKFSMQGEGQEPVEREVNSHAVKSVANAAGIDLDLSIENPLEQWATEVKSRKAPGPYRVVDLYDSQVAIELGHTFHLGTRYSEVLQASVMVDQSSSGSSENQVVPMQMGCHGIVVVGKGWKKEQTLEVQCRQLDDLRENVPLEQLSTFIQSLLERL